MGEGRGWGCGTKVYSVLIHSLYILLLDLATEKLTKAELIPTIKVLLTDDTTLPEILSNVLTLIKVITKSGKYYLTS